jgi:hypothetical protein
VSDVAPNGTATELASGALLGSFRALSPTNSWFAPDGKRILPHHPYNRASQKPVVPGVVTRFDIEVRPTFARLDAGHRLRVVLTSAETPHLLTTPPQTKNLIGGVYAIQRNAAGSSFIEVPIAPSSAFSTPCGICP